MTKMRMGLIALVVLALLVGASMVPIGGPSGDGKPVKSSAEQIARGKYLARAADCAACHTAPGGAAFAGGKVLESPFGNLYGSNITPDLDHGIGRWSADDFYKAMHDGTLPNGQPLYPAMPYTSYRAMPREDVDAVYAYLMQVPAIKQPNTPADLSFPYNMRFGVRFWKWIFLKDELPAASKGSSPEWQRGRYVSNVLGHCAECHTPRGKLGQLNLDQQLKGAPLGRFIAPDITPEGLAARGWTEVDLSSFMKTGIAPQGSAYSEMHLVVNLSTQYLSEADMKATTRFLMGDSPLAAVPVKIDAAAASSLSAGRQLYLNVCAGCHGVEGSGRPHVAVAMMGNSSLRLKDPQNLIVSMLDGLPAQEFPGLERMQDMPGFAGSLSDAELAELSNYLRLAFGGQPADVKPEQIKALRSNE